MRIVVCDNGLSQIGGHHYNLALGLRVELAERGAEMALLSHVTFPPSLCEALDARPTFHYSPYHRISRDRSRHYLKGQEYLGRRFASDLDEASVGTCDVLFLHSARASEIWGTAEWLSRQGAGRRPLVAINFMNADFTVGPHIVDPESSRDAYLNAFDKLFSVVPRERTCLSSSSAEIVAAMTELAGTPVNLYPMPKFVPKLDGVSRPPNAVALVGVLGPFNGDDRAVLIPDVARATAGRDLACRFLVQGPTHLVRRDLVDVYTALRSLPNVELTRTEMDFDAYFSAMFACDIVLINYDSLQYAAMTSGILSEAVAFGIPVVVPPNTWMSRQVAAGEAAGVIFAARTPSGIADAIARVLDDFDTFKAAASRCATHWRKTNGLGVFLDRLLADIAKAQRS